jgi:hypothetical protein
MERLFTKLKEWRQRRALARWKAVMLHAVSNTDTVWTSVESQVHIHHLKEIAAEATRIQRLLAHLTTQGE